MCIGMSTFVQFWYTRKWMEQFSSDTREIPSLMLNKIIQVMSEKWNNLVYFTYLNLQNYPFRLAFENHLKSAFLVGHRQT